MRLLLLTSLLLTTLSCSYHPLKRTQRHLASSKTLSSCMEQVLAIASGPSFDHEAKNLFQRSFQKAFSISSDIVSGKSVPNEKDINNLTEILHVILNIEKKYSFASPQAREEFFSNFFHNDFTNKNLLMSLKASVESIDYTPSYLPTEFELKSYYRNLLEQLNSFLPTDMRIVFKALPLDMDSARVNEQAFGVISRLSDHFNENFSTTGYQNYQKFVDDILRRRAEIGEEAVDIVLEDQMEIRMKRPFRTRYWIPKTGFQNQHVTQTSDALLSTNWRDQIESTLVKIDMEVYQDFRGDIKPKYAYISPKNLDEIKGYDDNFYGNDIYTFDLEKIKNRLTWSMGDSMAILGHHYQEENFKELVTQNYDSWDLSFIPWDNKALMIPYLENTMKSKLYKPGSVNPETFPSLKTSYFENEDRSYFEAQIWGNLTLDDVTSFSFTKNPPEGEFLLELQKRGIKILDARGQNEVPWDPSLEQVVVKKSKKKKKGKKRR